MDKALKLDFLAVIVNHVDQHFHCTRKVNFTTNRLAAGAQYSASENRIKIFPAKCTHAHA